MYDEELQIGLYMGGETTGTGLNLYVKFDVFEEDDFSTPWLDSTLDGSAFS